jgi:hypothetical protein
MAQTAYGGPVVSPGSIAVANEHGREEFGTEEWTVLSYSLMFGLRWVHIKRASDRWSTEIDQKTFRKNFELVKDSHNTDHFELNLPSEERTWQSGREGKTEIFRL